MSFVKPADITFQEISDHSGVGLRTVKRYASGENVTMKNAEAIDQAVSKIQSASKKATSKSIISSSEKEFFFPKSIFRQPLFWSSPIDKVRNIDGVIDAYIKTPNIYDIHTLVRLFGSDRVIAVARKTYVGILKNFGMSERKLHSLPEYQKVIRMVHYSLSIGSEND